MNCINLKKIKLASSANHSLLRQVRKHDVVMGYLWGCLLPGYPVLQVFFPLPFLELFTLYFYWLLYLFISVCNTASRKVHDRPMEN